jgi:hypothetical protein
MPWRRLGASQSNQFRLGLAVENALSGGVRRMLAGQCGLYAFFHEALACPSDRIDAGVQSGGDLAVTPGLRVPLIWISQRN